METFELYAMSLHSESLENMAANEKQIALITVFNLFDNTNELMKEIRKLEKV